MKPIRMQKLALHGGTPVRSRPFPDWPDFGESEERALLGVLQSGRWGRHQGTQTQAFERAFAAYQDARYGVAVMNGSVALHIALQAAGVQPGDEVILPPYTFYATASAVLEVNTVPVFVDIEPDTYCLDPKLIETAITEHTRAIIPVHFAGQAADMDAIMPIARRNNLIVIEDAAHAHGAEYRGRRLGSIGEMGCFSFQISKNLTAGEGGIILTSDREYERLCRALHTCGRYPESAWYDHFLLGGNYRMTEFQGALLLAQLERLEEQTRRREANGVYLRSRLASIPGIKPLYQGEAEIRHAYHIFIFRYDERGFDGLPRDRFLEALQAEGIPCSSGYPMPLYRQPVFTHLDFGPYSVYQFTHPELDYSRTNCPVSEQACREACWLAQPVLLGELEDMQDILSAIQKIYDQRADLL